MGRVKTTQIKRVTKKLIENHANEFKKDFNSNKKIVEKFIYVRFAKGQFGPERKCFLERFSGK